MDSNLTANSVLLSTLHDQERREERGVEKVTQKEARRYGIPESQRDGRIKYTYAGHVFIYDPIGNRAISSWKIENRKDRDPSSGGTNKWTKKTKEYTSGTRFEKPVMIHTSKDHEPRAVQESHDAIAHHIRLQKDKWKSHTVMVVDMSGSMREDDVNGARCRADGVWTTLAKDWVKQQLETGTCSLYDVVSVVAMRETAEVAVECEPMDWVLYNKLVSFREWDNMKPLGHGFYKPALEKANLLLGRNNHGSCSLSLLFFSDGKPSDCVGVDKEFDIKNYHKMNKDIVEYIGKLASRFGRRLNATFVGMADAKENFRTLQEMTDEAKSYGVVASFKRPSLNADALSQIISSSVASSLSSKLELTSVKTGHARAVRTDVERERHDTQDGTKATKDWRVFPSEDTEKFVVRVWTWNMYTNDFATVIDPRCQECYKAVASSDYHEVHKGLKYSRCCACFFCEKCLTGLEYKRHLEQDCNEMAHQRRTGYLVGRNCPYSFGVAWKRLAFGEGAERLAFKFRYIENRRFVGPKMVAKESRFVEDLQDIETNYLQSHRHTYHKTFMRTQAQASRLAKHFNEAMASKVSITDAGKLVKIQFLDPVIFELEDTTAATYNVLVEPMIEGEYIKFTDNNGNLDRDLKNDAILPVDSGIDVMLASKLLGRDAADLLPKPEVAEAKNLDNLGIIQEGSEEEESDEELMSDMGESDEDEGARDSHFRVGLVSDLEYLYAFSHFSYVRSGGRLMVVDLQGTLETKNDGKTFVLTDPAIHHDHRHLQFSHSKRRRQFGRTDMGRKGMNAFFASHECNDICRLFNFLDKKKMSLDRKHKSP